MPQSEETSILKNQMAFLSHGWKQILGQNTSVWLKNNLVTVIVVEPLDQVKVDDSQNKARRYEENRQADVTEGKWVRKQRLNSYMKGKNEDQRFISNIIEKSEDNKFLVPPIHTRVENTWVP